MKFADNVDRLLYLHQIIQVPATFNCLSAFLT